MQFRTKMVAGMLLKLVIVLMLIVSVWYQLTNVDRAGDRIVEDNKSSELTYQIHRRMKNEAISLRNVLLMKDPAAVQEERSKIDNYKTSIGQDLAALETNARGAEQRALVGELTAMNRSWEAYLDEVLASAAKGDVDEAIRIVTENGQQLNTEYFEVIDKITSAFEAETNESLGYLSGDLQRQMLILNGVTLLGLILVMGFVSRAVWTFAIRIKNVSDVMRKIASGGKADLATRIEVRSKDEIGDVAHSFNQLTESLLVQFDREQSLSQANQEEAWIKSNIAGITTELSGMQELDDLAGAYLNRVVPLVGACQAAFYLKQADSQGASYHLRATYAFKERKHLANRFSAGEGLVGQAALENKPILLTEVPADYIRVRSGLGEAAPLNVYVLPVSFKGEVLGVAEFASFIRFTDAQQSLLDELTRNLGILLDSAARSVELARLLEESQTITEELQAQSEELQSQQEELRAANEELEAQSQALKRSEERLQYQQEELEHSNTELREQAEALERQNRTLETTNNELERARAELEKQALELTLSSKYKTEFLANMSHELRTPLNSLLILSKLLADNAEGNLTEKQVEFSRTVYLSGCDLLAMINDILDLAKIESGKADVHASMIPIAVLVDHIEANFREVASDKGLAFRIDVKDDAPDGLYSDEQRIQQVLKNLLSNAFKFTDRGEVALEIGKPGEADGPYELYFSVKDTGIGIAKDKQELIFQAFQQADGTTSRKYGGTGLGLSISREIALLLGGEIVVESEEGKGSTFTFFLAGMAAEQSPNEASKPNRAAAQRVVIDEVAVTADAEPAVSAEPAEKPATGPRDQNSHIKRLLIVDDDLHQRNSLMELIGEKDIVIKAVSSGAEAIEEMKVGPFDCLLLDLGLTDTTGFELLETMKASRLCDNTVIMIYTGRELTAKQETYLKRNAHAIIIKDEYSPQRLMEELEATIFQDDHSSDPLSKTVPVSPRPTSDLAHKTVLLVDDDVRNVFALSNVLETHGMNVRFAENGREGLKMLEDFPDIEIVLMDIMMPEMDGYETIRRLRSKPDLKDLPVIALTAKAMKEDRDKCIEAGASDYIVKPVDMDQLLSLIRVWIYERQSE